MTRRRFSVFHLGTRSAALAIACTMLNASCAASADTRTEAELDAQFRLTPGQSAFVLPEQIEVRFVSVTADSRCGKGETCVWEGDATVQVTVARNGADIGRFELHTAARMGNTASFDGYHVRLVALMPPAISGRAIAADQYVAVLQIARGYAGNDGLY